MANEIATRNNNSVSTTVSNGNPFMQAASALGGGNEGLTFLSFSGKNGEYTYGAGKEELDDGWEGTVNMNSAKRGHICWSDSTVVGEDMVRVLDGNPTPKNQLEDHGPYSSDDDGWQEQISFEVVELKEGEQLLFKNSSKSGLRAFGNLLAAYGKAMMKGQNIGDNGEDLHPIVKFENMEFTPKNSKSKKDRAYAPSFKIIDWISEEELAEKFGGAENPDNYDNDESDEDETAVKEVKETVKSNKTAQEEAVAEEAPTEGRRRRRFA